MNHSSPLHSLAEPFNTRATINWLLSDFPSLQNAVAYYDPHLGNSAEEEAVRMRGLIRFLETPIDTYTEDKFTGHVAEVVTGDAGTTLILGNIFGYIMPEIADPLRIFFYFGADACSKWGHQKLSRLFAEFGTVHEFAHVVSKIDPAWGISNAFDIKIFERIADSFAVLFMLTQYPHEASTILDFADLMAQRRNHFIKFDPDHDTAAQLTRLVANQRRKTDFTTLGSPADIYSIARNTTFSLRP